MSDARPSGDSAVAARPTLPPLARDIGQAERAMQPLLARLLRAAGISFSEYTVLRMIRGSGSLDRATLVRNQVELRLVDDAEAARASVDRLLELGYIASEVGSPGRKERTPSRDQVPLAFTGTGERMFGPLDTSVATISERLYGDLPLADLEATHRTLAEVARRARVLGAAAE